MQYIEYNIFTKIHCRWLGQPKPRSLSKVFNTSKHLFSEKEIKYASHSCPFVFSPNSLSYLALFHPATILAKTFGTLGLFLFTLRHEGVDDT